MSFRLWQQLPYTPGASPDSALGRYGGCLSKPGISEPTHWGLGSGTKLPLKHTETMCFFLGGGRRGHVLRLKIVWWLCNTVRYSATYVETLCIHIRYIRGPESRSKRFIHSQGGRLQNTPKQDEPSILRWPRRTARNALHYLEIYLGEEVRILGKFLRRNHGLGDSGVLSVFS